MKRRRSAISAFSAIAALAAGLAFALPSPALACPSCGGAVAPAQAEPWGLVGLFLLVPIVVGGVAIAMLAPWRPPGANPPSSSS